MDNYINSLGKNNHLLNPTRQLLRYSMPKYTIHMVVEEAEEAVAVEVVEQCCKT